MRAPLSQPEKQQLLGEGSVPAMFFLVFCDPVRQHTCQTQSRAPAAVTFVDDQTLFPGRSSEQCQVGKAN